MIAVHKTRFLYYSYERYILMAAAEDANLQTKEVRVPTTTLFRTINI